MNNIINIALIIVVVYIAICAFYFIFQERFIFVPWGKKRSDAPILLGSEFTEYFLDGAYNGRIHAIHIKVRTPRGIIIYFHGNTGSMDRWGAIAEELTSFGFDIFLPDYRGYGKSRGSRTEETLYSDALLCYKKVQELYPEKQICIYGRSLGTAMASWLSAYTHPGAVVLETPFNNMIEVGMHHSKIIPVKLFLRYTFRNDLHLKQAKSPVLIAHGTKDNVVKYKSGLRLYKSLKDHAQAEMLTIPGGNHGNLNGFPVFRDTLNRFFDKHFPR
ncbi:alpha/beta fold hydrolase [Cryomorpha ignava]|uniref:Alpha/beta fold hydrolase n=1 Tax=Cryomorpha ignava TaxID=101383 RepID=A0A7K3WLY2_9FLAO|nr:alpha/beta fold hydrolase [Cryomorpha ignava]NEN22657.1 alpha/beta fold hydrolase [Cryomorpha ignava]